MMNNDNLIFGGNMMNSNMNNFFGMNVFNNNMLFNMNNFQDMNMINNLEITLRFSFTNGLKFLVKGKMSEKLSDVIDRFKQTNNIDDPMNAPISEGNKIHKDKTLLELGLKNYQIILFICQQKSEEEIEQIKEKYHLNEEEKLQIKKWLYEFEIRKSINIDNNGHFDESENNNFLQFVKQKEKMCFIITKEHPHKLVYCISLLDWKCSLCKNNFQKKEAKYYCSLCGFNMCDNCHSKGRYIKKKSFPDNITPSNINITNPIIETEYHFHNLFYCRSSRSVIGYNTWTCDTCKIRFENDIWSFYCTQCDFDLCARCAGFN